MKVFLLHTVRPGLNRFEKLLKERYPHVRPRNMLDDFWIREVEEHHRFTENCRRHLLEVCASMERSGADLIVCTCSSLTPYLDDVRKFLEIPVVAIDETMAARTLEYGDNILVMATADTAIDAAVQQIEEEARRQNRNVNIGTLLLDEAGQIMRGGGDMAEHDRIILESFRNMGENKYDVIVCAQLSTSHLAEEIGRITRTPVLTTPMLCIEDLKNYIPDEPSPSDKSALHVDSSAI